MFVEKTPEGKALQRALLQYYEPRNAEKVVKALRMTHREDLIPLLVPLFIDGKQVYQSPDVHALRAYNAREMDSFWEEYKRVLNPQAYKVDISDKLYDLKQRLIRENAKRDVYA